MAHTLHQRQYLQNLSQGPNPNEHLWVFYGMILTHCMQPHVGGTHSHVSAFEDLLCTSRPGQNPRRAVQLSVPLRVDRHTQQALAPWNPCKISIHFKKEEENELFLLWI